MKLGTLVQVKAYNRVLDMGFVSKYDNDSEWVWVRYLKMGDQRVRKDSTIMEVLSEAR